MVLTDTLKSKRDVSTLKGLIDEYIEFYAKPKKLPWHDDLRILNKDVLPALKFMQTTDITERDIVKLLGRINDQISSKASNKALNILQSMFEYAVSRGFIESSPCADLELQIEETFEDRVFTEEEVKKFWSGLDKAKMSEGTRLALKVLLLTGQRNGEVAGAKWQEFNLREKWWTIPAARTKNKKSHRIFLTPMVMELLQTAKKLSGSSSYVFPSGKDKAISPRAINRAVKNNSENKPQSLSNNKPQDLFGVGPFVPNDLRRTASALMAEAGVDEHNIAKVQNHAIPTQNNRANYDRDKQQALEILERKIRTILFSGPASQAIQ